uniref:Uncharacterized protein n=1 Tax=Callorhinchus milii TaxID=7868 RepID=A0A4W3J8B6_CALMI
CICFHHRFLGEVNTNLKDVLNSPNLAANYNLTLLDPKKQSTGATIILQVSYLPPPGAAPLYPSPALNEATSVTTTDTDTPTDTGGEAEGEEDTEDSVDPGEEDKTPTRIPGAETPAAPKLQPPSSGKALRKRKHSARPLLPNKPQDFQVRPSHPVIHSLHHTLLYRVLLHIG